MRSLNFNALFQIGLVVFIGIITLAAVHEFGHWLGYQIVGVDSSIQWLKTPPNLDDLTNGKNLFGLLSGLLFQSIPGGLAAIFLANVNATSRTALSVIIASWLIRPSYMTITVLLVAISPSHKFSDPNLGDEFEIQRIIAGDTGSGLAWIVAIGLVVFPILIFVISQWRRRLIWATFEWCVIGIAGWFIIFTILLTTT